MESFLIPALFMFLMCLFGVIWTFLFIKPKEMKVRAFSLSCLVTFGSVLVFILAFEALNPIHESQLGRFCGYDAGTEAPCPSFVYIISENLFSYGFIYSLILGILFSGWFLRRLSQNLSF